MFAYFALFLMISYSVVFVKPGRLTAYLLTYSQYETHQNGIN